MYAIILNYEKIVPKSFKHGVARSFFHGVVTEFFCWGGGRELDGVRRMTGARHKRAEGASHFSSGHNPGK